MISQEVQGYKVFPLQFSSRSKSCHHIYVKEHSVRNQEEDKPPGLTLFVLNVPPYATEDSLKHAFSEAGKVRKVLLEEFEESIENNDGFKRAFVVFAKRESLLRALKLDSLLPLSSDESPIITGIRKWTDEYNSLIVDPQDLQTQIDSFMKVFEKKEKAEKTKETTTDDEGWTLVTRAGRKPGLARKQSVENKLTEKAKKKSSKKELKNFYTFQIRESQMKNIATLRKNYEEAKNKVEMMKKARKFKPYLGR